MTPETWNKVSKLIESGQIKEARLFIEEQPEEKEVSVYRGEHPTEKFSYYLKNTKNKVFWLEFLSEIFSSPKLSTIQNAFLKALVDRSPTNRIRDLGDHSLDYKLPQILIPELINHLELPQVENLLQLLVKEVHLFNKMQNLCKLIMKDSDEITSSPLAIKLLFTLDDCEKKLWYENLLELSYYKYDSISLKFLKALDNKKGFDFYLALEKLNFKPEQRELLEQFLLLDEEIAENIRGKMQPFINGPLGKDMGYDQGLLAIAARRERKKYLYNPTLIEIPKIAEEEIDDYGFTICHEEYDVSQFRSYLQILSKAPRPLTERFIISSYHWIAGEININKEGVTRVFFIDSMKMQCVTAEAASTVSEFFPQCKFFYAQEQRQNTRTGCSIFALDDMAHLFSPYFNQSKLWDYIEDKAVLMRGRTHEVGLPGSLLRTMQSESLYKDILPSKSEKEQTYPVNRNGETLLASSMKFFTPREDDGKMQNQRLLYKFNKILEEVFSFLINNPQAKVEHLCQQANLNSFEKRMQELVEEHKVAVNLGLMALA